jgi:hypothetical protein
LCFGVCFGVVDRVVDHTFVWSTARVLWWCSNCVVDHTFVWSTARVLWWCSDCVLVFVLVWSTAWSTARLCGQPRRCCGGVLVAFWCLFWCGQPRGRPHVCVVNRAGAVVVFCLRFGVCFGVVDRVVDHIFVWSTARVLWWCSNCVLVFVLVWSTAWSTTCLCGQPRGCCGGVLVAFWCLYWCGRPRGRPHVCVVNRAGAVVAFCLHFNVCFGVVDRVVDRTFVWSPARVL